MTEIAPHIVIDPTVRFGKPTIKGTRMTVDEVLGYVAGGMSFDDLQDEYGLTKTQALAAINYAASFLKGEAVAVSEQPDA